MGFVNDLEHVGRALPVPLPSLRIGEPLVPTGSVDPILDRIQPIKDIIELFVKRGKFRGKLLLVHAEGITHPREFIHTPGFPLDGTGASEYLLAGAWQSHLSARPVPLAPASPQLQTRDPDGLFFLRGLG